MTSENGLVNPTPDDARGAGRGGSSGLPDVLEWRHDEHRNALLTSVFLGADLMKLARPKETWLPPFVLAVLAATSAVLGFLVVL